MRYALLLATAAVVVVANGWGVLQGVRNRIEPRGGTLELTENELRLQPVALESSITVLRLRWDVRRSGGGEPYEPVPWLDGAKLAELGFDCTVPVTSPSARNHYGSMPSRPVFFALELQAPAGENADAKAKTKSRLFVIDAATEANRLRERYPDPQHTVICRGLVRLHLRDREFRDGTPLDTPRLAGYVQSLLPADVFVPLPHNRAIKSLRRPQLDAPHEDQPEASRFSARVSWGSNYEPWVETIRLLDGAPVDAKGR